MADIAIVFHCSPFGMDELTLGELSEWRERARVRNGTE
ncbi:GpE family phage tail protein [Caballeronia sp. 15715]|jgi:Phage P2 GpE|nr:GpE family phage tail protein [Caballeronia udeis]